MAARTLLAICEEAGYRLHQSKHLTRRYVCDVLQHEKDEKTGKLISQDGPAKAGRSPEDRLRELFAVLRKLPAWIAEAKVRQATARAGGAKPKKK